MSDCLAFDTWWMTIPKNSNQVMKTSANTEEPQAHALEHDIRCLRLGSLMHMCVTLPSCTPTDNVPPRCHAHQQRHRSTKGCTASMAVPLHSSKRTETRLWVPMLPRYNTTSIGSPSTLIIFLANIRGGRSLFCIHHLFPLLPESQTILHTCFS